MAERSNGDPRDAIIEVDLESPERDADGNDTSPVAEPAVSRELVRDVSLSNSLSALEPPGLWDQLTGEPLHLTVLPEEVLLRIMGFLPARDLCFVGFTCRRLHGLCLQPVLWNTVLWRDFDRYDSKLEGNDKMNGRAAKNRYGDLLTKVNSKRTRRTVELAVKRERQLREQRQRTCARWYERFHLHYLVPAVPLTVLLFTILLLVHLQSLDQQDDQGDGAVPVSLGGALAPLYALLALLALALCSVLLARRAEQSGGAGPLWLCAHAGQMRSGCLPWLGATRPPRALLGGLAAALLLALWLALLQARLQRAIDWPFPLVFLPLWLLFLLLCLSPALGWYASLGPCLALWLLLLLPLLAVALLLALRLERALEAPLTQIFIPFFLYEALLLLLPLLALLTAATGYYGPRCGALRVCRPCRRVCCPGHECCCVSSFSQNELAHYALIFLVAYSIFLPITMFHILLGLRDAQQHQYSYGSILAPLIVTESLLFLASVIISCSYR